MGPDVSLDILAALDAAPAGRTGDACKVQRWLDTIPHDAPGREALEATFTQAEEGHPDYRTYEQLAAVAARLGMRTSVKTIGDHRRRQCRCFY